MPNRLETILETVAAILEAGPAQARTRRQKPRKTVVDPKVERQWSKEGTHPAWMWGAANTSRSTTRGKMRSDDAEDSSFKSSVKDLMKRNPGMSPDRARDMASSMWTRGT